MEKDTSNEFEFEEYYDKLLRSEGASPLTITSVYARLVLYSKVKYVNSQELQLPPLDHISNVQKHTKCFVIIYFISQLFTATRAYYLNAFQMFTKYEKHSFMVYVTGNELNHVARQEMFRKTYFPYMETTVIEIYDKLELDLICIHCSNYAIPIENWEPGADLYILNKLWDSIQRNQNGFKLGFEVNSSFFKQKNMESTQSKCGPWSFYDTKITATPFTCALLEFSTRHNFTLIDRASHYKLIERNRIDFLTEEQIRANLTQFFVYNDNKYKIHVFFYLRVEPYHMIVVLDSNEISQTNRRALLTSMDEYTWLMSMISMFGIASSLYYFRIILHEKYLVGVLISIFGTLINQGMKLPQIKFSLLVTFGIWSLVTIVITNGYAGLLLSLLTKPTIPEVPNDLAGLFSSPLQFTMASFAHAVALSAKNNTRLRKSETPFLLSVTGYRDALLESGRGCFICDKIIDSMKSLSGDVVRDLIEIRNDGRISKQIGKPSFKNFVLVTEKIYEQLVIESVRIAFQKQKVVVKTRPTQPFSSIILCKAYRSYASRMAEKHFSRIFSSGIFSQWTAASFLSAANKLGIVYDSVSKMTIRKSRYSKLLLPNAYQREDPKKLTLEHFVIPYVILGAALLICTFYFLIECVNHLWNTYTLLKITLAGIETIQSV